MNTPAKQIGSILLASAVLAVAANFFHPRRIPWIQDWSHQVEDRAAQHEIRLVSHAGAVELFETQSAVFIDARPEAEFLKGHIPDAFSSPLESWDQHFMVFADYIAAGSKLIVYCSNRECDDALLLAKELQSMGGNVALFIDGFEGWKAHGGEVGR